MRLTACLITLSSAILGACDAHVPEPAAGAPAADVTAEACAVPSDLRAPRPYRVPADEVVDHVPTAYHLLAVSWSPQACRTGADYPDARHQCGENRFGLTLHGLWPNGKVGQPYPRYCNPEAAREPIRIETVRRHFCMTPSPELLQHEWAAHGVCGWSDPEAYFADAARLWDALNRPDLEAIPADRLTAGAIRRAFAQANPGLSERSVIVSVADGWFREARICYGLDDRFIPCPGSLGPSDDTRLRLAARGAATGR